MLTNFSNVRYRGWRFSKHFVELGRGAAGDFTRISQNGYENDEDYDTIESLVTDLNEDLISELQHLRCQIRYRLRNHS